MSPNVTSYTPPRPLEELCLPPGQWLVLNEEFLVALSGKYADEVIAEAHRLKIDLKESPIHQMPTEADHEELFFDL